MIEKDARSAAEKCARRSPRDQFAICKGRNEDAASWYVVMLMRDRGADIMAVTEEGVEVL